jgi:hypothetical protein
MSQLPVLQLSLQMSSDPVSRNYICNINTRTSTNAECLYFMNIILRITRQKPSFATICKYALLCALHNHDMFRPSYKRPSSGDYHVIQNIKKKVTIRCNGSVACRDHGEHTIKHIYGLLRTRVFVL